MAKRVTNEQIMDKLVKIEKNNRLVSALAVVFFLQTIYLTCLTLTLDSKDLIYLYLGLVVYAVALGIFIWEVVKARKK